MCGCWSLLHGMACRGPRAVHQLPHILSSEASHGDSSECPGNLDITQVDVVNTGTYADPRSSNWETKRTKSRGNIVLSGATCFFLAARLEALVRSGHLGANPVGSKPQQRSATHLGHTSETGAVPEEISATEGKRNNISGSERLSPESKDLAFACKRDGGALGWGGWWYHPWR